METTSRFASRIRTDMSVEMIRVKMARRRSQSQKENRDRLLSAKRGLSVLDPNISTVIEVENSAFEESCLSQKKVMVSCENNAAVERQKMLQRYKEAKLVTKMKEQREKAKKGVFKVGVFKPEPQIFLPLPALPHGYTVQPKAQSRPPTISQTRITRSMVKKPPDSKDAKRFPESAVKKTETVVNKKQPTAPPPASRKAVQPPIQSKAPTARAVKTPSTQLSNSRTTRQPVTGKGPLKDTKGSAKNETVKSFEKKSTFPSTIPTVDTIHELAKQPIPEEAQLPDALPHSPVKQASVEEVEVDEAASFAPPNFVFQPPESLRVLSISPMSPRSADAFLMPTLQWNSFDESKRSSSQDSSILPDTMSSPSGPVQENDEVFSFANSLPCKKEEPVCVSIDDEEEDVTAAPCEVPICPSEESSVASPVLGDPVAAVEHHQENTAQHSSPSLKDLEIPASCAHLVPVPDHAGSETTDQVEMRNLEEQNEETLHDVLYFRRVIQQETDRLTHLCVCWECKTEGDGIPEEVGDQIRTTVGQARLLMVERFKQFAGLVDNCEFKRGEKETTCTDLEGFWDMVYYQVEDVSKKFSHLSKLEENGWKEVTQTAPRVRKTIKKAAASKPLKTEGASTAAAKSRLAAVKAAMKARKQAAPSVSESPAPMVVFDAGFFKVESPAKIGLAERTPYKATPHSVSKFAATPRNRVEHNNSIALACPALEALQSSESPCRFPDAQVQCSPQSSAMESMHLVNEETETKLKSPTSPESADSSKVEEPCQDFEKYLQPTGCIAETPAICDEDYELTLLRTPLLEGTPQDTRVSDLQDVEMSSPAPKIMDTSRVVEESFQDNQITVQTPCGDDTQGAVNADLLPFTPPVLGPVRQSLAWRDLMSFTPPGMALDED
ncbi:disks large-associated protein 5 [Polypterus senegalus]|uniref:disks large-associated protein 5 n=1 Tax=Polypterus senegalus TaxID=55291 RepID=UPI001964F823|nr:disks large-associated protein 5 [Polypterus senegalus]